MSEESSNGSPAHAHTGSASGILQIAEEKRRLRAEMNSRLAALDPAERRAASRAACARLLELDEVRDASIVLVFMAMKTELDPAAAAYVCLEEGIRIAVPVIDEASGELEAMEIESLDERHFAKAKLGILEPTGGRRIRATEIDATIVPGLAFDRAGRRLGRGAGYYDRLLVRLPERCRTIGFTLDRQVVERVPTDAGDQRVQMLVTESFTAVCE
jgi:5-formyltetrahydrofolate cyclo-ligase